MQGVPLATVSVLMGHRSTRMTEHYLHLSGEAEYLAQAALQTLPKERKEGAA